MLCAFNKRGIAIKTYSHVKYYEDDLILPHYSELTESNNIRELLIQEMDIINGIKNKMNLLLGAYNLSKEITIMELYDRIKNDSTTEELYFKLLKISYWRDKCSFNDFNLYPSNISPFKWYGPIQSINYSTMDRNRLAMYRVDFSAYYYCRYILGEKRYNELLKLQTRS